MDRLSKILEKVKKELPRKKWEELDPEHRAEFSSRKEYEDNDKLFEIMNELIAKGYLIKENRELNEKVDNLVWRKIIKGVDAGDKENLKKSLSDSSEEGLALYIENLTGNAVIDPIREGLKNEFSN